MLLSRLHPSDYNYHLSLLNEQSLFSYSFSPTTITNHSTTHIRRYTTTSPLSVDFLLLRPPLPPFFQDDIISIAWLRMKTKRKRARCCCCSWSSSSSSLESWSCCSSSWCCPCCNSSVNEEDAGKGGTRNNIINEIFVLVLRDGVVALVGSRNGAMVLLVFSSLFVAFTSRLFLFRFFCERLVVFFFWWMMDLRKGETLSHSRAHTYTTTNTRRYLVDGRFRFLSELLNTTDRFTWLRTPSWGMIDFCWREGRMIGLHSYLIIEYTTAQRDNNSLLYSVGFVQVAMDDIADSPTHDVMENVRNTTISQFRQLHKASKSCHERSNTRMNEIIICDSSKVQMGHYDNAFT